MYVIIFAIIIFGVITIRRISFEPIKNENSDELEKRFDSINNTNNFYKNGNVNFFDRMTNKGTRGEYRLYNFLSERIALDKVIINNIYLEKQNGKTTEIDIILICCKGIFVFEVKNYSGWIFGSRNSKYWTQRMQNGKTYSFLSPILQNESHIREIKGYLNISRNDIVKSIVVFVGVGEIKTDIEYIKNNYVIDDMNTAKHIIELSENVFTEEQIKRIYEKLIVKTGKSKEFKQNHINNIHS